MMARLLIAPLTCLVWLGCPLQAWAAPEVPECREGQYILRSSVVPALQRKAVELLESATGEDFHIAAATGQAVLVDKYSAGRAEKIVGADKAAPVCHKLERQRRSARQTGKTTIDGNLLRRVECSCNARVKIRQIPNDTNMGFLWGMHQANDIDIDAPEAWDISTGSSNVVVAVIDTGVDYNHGDLTGNIWTNPFEIASNGIDDDGNGFVDDIHGANAIWYQKSGNPMDDHGHGTHVAGTIGARGNNAAGVAGAAWNVQIMGVKFLDCAGRGYLFDAVTAIDYVNNMRRRGVNVVLSSNSWGGGGFDASIYSEIVESRDLGMLFVAAAGNNASNNDGAPAYPASYQIENMISVAAVDGNGALAWFSNYGTGSVHIGAPGVNTLSTYPGGVYKYMSGTSMATPHVSGVLALLSGYASHLQWWELRQILLDSAPTLPGLVGKVNGARFLNAYQALQHSALYPPDPNRPTPTPFPTLTPTPTITPTPTRTPTITPTMIATPTPTRTPKPGPYVLSGKAIRQAGSAFFAVPNAQVRIEVEQPGGGRLVLTRTSDSSGRYEFFVNIANPADFTLTADATGLIFTPAAAHFDADVTLNLYASSPTLVLSGQLITQENIPLGGYSIDAGSYGQAVTDTEGRFSFWVPAGSDYTLNATVPDYIVEQRQGTMYGDVDRVLVAVPQ